MDESIEKLIPPIMGKGNDWSPFENQVKARFYKRVPEDYTLPVTVVIPVYNRIDKLGKTISALTHQTYPHELMEIVIADDGSSDNPETLISTFNDYFEMKHIFQEDRGYRLSEIRNKGVAAASNENIIILDCDMLPEPSLVESFMQYAHISKRCVMIGGRRYVNTDNLTMEDVIDDIDSVLNLPSLKTDTGMVPVGDDSPSEDWRYKIYRATENLKTEKHPFRAFCGGNVCFHRSLLDVVGGFDESFTAWGAEDTEFGFRVYNHGYWFIPVEGAGALHQEPPGGSNETDRDAGRSITQPILIEKCPSFYRKMEKDRIYEIPKVSVYMPAYNCQAFVQEAIDSVLNQTYTDLEIVVVNDGSTDNTRDILEENYGNNPRVVIIHQENGGISSASNTALANCRGEYVLQLDSDDAILPITVESLVKVLEQNDVGFVYGDAYLTDESGRAYDRAYSWSVFSRKKLLQGMMVHHPRMFRMRDYRRMVGFDEKLTNAVDYDLFLKLSEVTDGYHLQTPLYLYRQHNTNTSRVNTEEQDFNTRRTIEMAFERIGLSGRINLQPDPKHNRKMLLEYIDSPEEFRLDMTANFNRLGIENPTDSNLHIWEINKNVSPGSLSRQSMMNLGSNRIIRVGSFGSVNVANSVSQRIENELGRKTEIRSVRQANKASYFIEVQASTNDRQSVELRRTLQEEYGWSSEIVTEHGPCPIRARNQDTREVLKEYESSLHSLEPTVQEIEESPEEGHIAYLISDYWRLVENRLNFCWEDEDIFFDMPNDWKIEETHEDLFRLAHYVLTALWDKSSIESWTPSRKPGWRPGLAFSGGVDSAAAMELMPTSTVLVYNERSGIEGILNHTNAHRFFEEILSRTGRSVIRIPSNHEMLRVRDGKIPGFSTDYACAVQVILLADYYGFDSIGTGMPLENSFLWHGYRYREFTTSWFWKHHGPLFSSVGLDLYQPVVGCSEIINMKIVNDTGWEGWAQSCLRSNRPGQVCGKCWKCFRKNTLVGLPFEYAGEIAKFLEKRPLKQGASTLYSIQKGGVSKEGIVIVDEHPDLKPLMDLDLDFLNRYIPASIDLLPSRYRRFTEQKLSEFCERMTPQDLESLSQIDFTEEE